MFSFLAINKLAININLHVTKATAISEPSDLAARKSSPWILNPAADILFCCGGAAWLLFILQNSISYFLAPSLVQMTSLTILTCSHLFSEAHVSATLFKIYRNKDTRERFAISTLWQPIIAAALCIVALKYTTFLGVLLKIYFLWLYQHFTGQAYGLILLYCIKSNYVMSKIDKSILAVLLYITASVPITYQLGQEAGSMKEFLGIDLPPWNFLPLQIHQFSQIMLLTVIIIFVLKLASNGARQSNQFPLPAILTLLTIVVGLSADQQQFGELWFYLPAFFHATQYLTITASQYIKEASNLAKAAQPKLAWKQVAIEEGLNYYKNLLLISVAIYVLLPVLIHFLGFNWQSSFASVFVVINLHHFATDAIIWKLRDKKTLRELV